MQLFLIEKNQAGQRLDKFLHKYLPEAPNSFLYKMLRKKNITLNNKRAEGKEILSVGDEIKFFLAADTLEKFSGRTFFTEEPVPKISFPTKPFGENLSKTKLVKQQNPEIIQKENRLSAFCIQAYQNQKGISVLYEDDHVLILNKPAGILTQKAAEKDISLNEWMIGYLLCNNNITPKDLETFHPSVCNRLDRNTSGLVLCGKSLLGSQELSELIRNRRIHKYYRTIVQGILKETKQIDGILYKEEKNNLVTILPNKKENLNEKGNYIQTAYSPIHFHYENNATYLEVELITGKTHQIRSHLASIGHPLFGDPKYGNPQLNQELKKQYLLKYQLLHAFRLDFPVLEGALKGLSNKQVTAPLPPYFSKILSALQFV